MSTLETIGIIASVGCALCWSISMILFRKAGEQHPPVAVNLFKNYLAFALMLPTAWLIEPPLPALSTQTWVLMLVSGALGIGIADALVLKALHLVGASRLAIIECLYAPFVIVIAVMFLDESFGMERALGTVAVLSAVLMITQSQERDSPIANRVWAGVAFGASGLLAMAVGITMVKPVFAQVPLFWLIALRLAAGVIGSAIVVRGVGLGVIHSQRLLWHSSDRRVLLMASVLSSYVAMAMWVTGFKYAEATVAAVLNQSSTVFTVALAALFLKEPFTRWQAAGTAVAIAGVLTVVFA